MEATVALVQTRPETVLQDYERVLHLAGLAQAGGARSSAALCMDHDPYARSTMPAAGSPPWQVEGVARCFLASGYPAENLRALAPAKVRSDSDLLVMWQALLSRIGLHPLQRRSVSFDAGMPLLLLAALRTDRLFGFAGCLGALAAHLLPSVSRSVIARQPLALLDAWRTAGDAAVLGGVIDATTCGAGSEAWSLQPAAAHLLLAGRDPVAVDAIAAWLAGFDPMSLPLLRAASDAGLGCNDPGRIRIVGDVYGGLPQLGLASAARNRSLSAIRSWLPRRAFLGIAPYLPWVFLRARRSRQRFEATAWGRLQQDYSRRGFPGGRGDSTSGEPRSVIPRGDYYKGRDDS